MSQIVERLIEEFLRFPGIGRRQARRFVYYLLQADEKIVQRLLSGISELKKGVTRCHACGRFFAPNQRRSGSLCSLCADSHRDQSVLMIVEKDIDLENMEKTGVYQGRYFVLGGLVPLLASQPEEHFRSKELRRIVAGEKNLKEIIIALSATSESDHMVDILKKFLLVFVEKRGIKISVLGRGLSTGTELEYSDSETLKNALKNRG